MNRFRRSVAAALVLFAVCVGTAGAVAHAHGPESGQSVEAGRTWAK